MKKKHDTKLDKTAKHHDKVVSDAEKKALIKIEALREKAIPGAKAARTPFLVRKVHLVGHLGELFGFLHATDNTQAEMLFAKYANKMEHGNDCLSFATKTVRRRLRS